MELSRHVQAIQSDLEAVSALGDDAAAEAAHRLSEALGPSLQLRLLDFLTEATLTLNEQLPQPTSRCVSPDATPSRRRRARGRERRRSAVSG